LSGSTLEFEEGAALPASAANESSYLTKLGIGNSGGELTEEQEAIV
jgi:hypothetical protein